MPPRALFRLFPLAARASRALEQRFTLTGRLLMGVLLSAAILGIDIGQTLAYQLAVLAFSLLVASFVLTLRWRPRLDVRRILPNMVTHGVASHYWLEITNRGPRTESDVLVQDTLVQPPLSLARFKTLRDMHSGGDGNWFDRAVGFPRWVAMRRRERGAEIVAVTLPPIPAGATARVRVELSAQRRGWLRFASLCLMRPDPLGLCRARHHVALADKLLALPRRHAMPDIQLASRRHYQPGGLSLAHAVGDSQEFAALRAYQAGDPRRHIHWRSFAKTGELIVKQYQDEYFDRHALIVDTRSAAAPARFEAVIEVAASVLSKHRAQDSILDLVIAGTDVLELHGGRGRGDNLRALAYLAETVGAESDDIAGVAALLRARMGQLASIILVFGHFDAQRRALLDELRAHGLATLCLLVVGGQDDAEPAPSSLAVQRLRTEQLAADLAQIRTGS
ncbi:MAG: DUF58 domain-containing protein [Gammaproteobacteria bacterium]|nr:DUF58 domain-containing protein [Gammaproteobacteria bacterium]